FDLCNHYGRDEHPYVHHGRSLADRYVSAGHGSNLWSSACFCSSLSFLLAVTPPWQGGAQRTTCTAEVLSHARRLRGTFRHRSLASSLGWQRSGLVRSMLPK